MREPEEGEFAAGNLSAPTARNSWSPGVPLESALRGAKKRPFRWSAR